MRPTHINQHLCSCASWLPFNCNPSAQRHLHSPLALTVGFLIQDYLKRSTFSIKLKIRDILRKDWPIVCCVTMHPCRCLQARTDCTPGVVALSPPPTYPHASVLASIALWASLFLEHTPYDHALWRKMSEYIYFPSPPSGNLLYLLIELKNSILNLKPNSVIVPKHGYTLGGLW